jgi:hypothetical protein
LARQATHQAGTIRNQSGNIQHAGITRLVYADTDKNNLQLTEGWIKKISNHEMSDWQRLLSDFETYPMMR